MDAPQILVLHAEETPQRIDNYLFSACKGVPKSHIYKLLRSGQIRVNKKRIKFDYRLLEGDQLRLPPMLRIAKKQDASAAQSRAAVGVAFDILFEDEALIVLNKPAGMAVHGGSGVSLGVIETLRLQRPRARFLELVHRLDKDTSGVLLVAKKRAALVALHHALQYGAVDKKYHALTLGNWSSLDKHSWLNITLPLVKYLDNNGERRVRVEKNTNAHAKEAHSKVRLISLYPNFSLVEVSLKTGRTHQIRVHLESQGFPILGDQKYGDFGAHKTALRNQKNSLPPLKQMFLHAFSLSFAHPLTEEKMYFSAPLPKACRRFLDALATANEASFTST